MSTPDDDLARSKLAIETRLKRADQALARAQFDWQRAQASRSGLAALLSPTGVVLAGAALGLLGTAAGKWADYLTNKRQQETTIILKASDVPASLSPQLQDEQRARNLLWFAKAHYIDLPADFLGQLEKASNLSPGQSLPPPVVQTAGPVPKEAVDLVSRFEGAYLKVYRDTTGAQVIGSSHVLTPDELASGVIQAGGESIRFADGITDAQARTILQSDLAPSYAIVDGDVKVPLNGTQRDALASFVFSMGRGVFERSELLRVLNAGQYDAVPDELEKFSKMGGMSMPGLVLRRKAEIELWKTPPKSTPPAP